MSLEEYGASGQGCYAACLYHGLNSCYWHHASNQVWHAYLICTLQTTVHSYSYKHAAMLLSLEHKVQLAVLWLVVGGLSDSG